MSKPKRQSCDGCKWHPKDWHKIAHMEICKHPEALEWPVAAGQGLWVMHATASYGPCGQDRELFEAEHEKA